jgi:hypothetical protein
MARKPKTEPEVIEDDVPETIEPEAEAAEAEVEEIDPIEQQRMLKDY